MINAISGAMKESIYKFLCILLTAFLGYMHPVSNIYNAKSCLVLKYLNACASMRNACTSMQHSRASIRHARTSMWHARTQACSLHAERWVCSCKHAACMRKHASCTQKGSKCMLAHAWSIKHAASMQHACTCMPHACQKVPNACLPQACEEVRGMHAACLRNMRAIVVWVNTLYMNVFFLSFFSYWLDRYRSLRQGVQILEF